MADFMDCTTTFQNGVIKSLIEKDANGQYGLRTSQKTRDADAQTIYCNSNQHFWQLFQEALEIGTDSKIVLRTVIEAKVGGDGLSSTPDCGTAEDLMFMLGNCFCTDTNGDTCFLIWNIT